MHLSALATSNGGKYNLSSFDRSSVEPSVFIDWMLEVRHLMYNWGDDDLFACRVPFSVDYSEKTITDADGSPINDSDWVSCRPDDLHSLLERVFEGEWGPTAADTILRLMRSGVVIDIYNIGKLGPKDPRAFLKSLTEIA